MPDSDGWRWSYDQTVQFQGPGEPAQALAGATVVRTDGDGHESIFTADPARGVYRCLDHSGAQDELRYDGAAVEWVLTGGTRRTERTRTRPGPR